MKKKWSAREIESILSLSSLITSSLDISDVLNNSMRVVEDLMDAAASSVFEIDPRTNELFFRLARGSSAGAAEEVRLNMGEGIAGWAASTGEAVVVPDVEKDARFSRKMDRLSGFRTRSVIAVPIRYRGQVTGVIEVINCSKAHHCDGNDMDILTIVASQTGIALENARLYERMKKKFALTREELKETRAKLIESERIAALGHLSRGVAHVVRNPVMSIAGFTQRLRKKLASDPVSSEYLDLILGETARLERIVESIGEYTAITLPERSRVRLSELLKHIAEHFNQPGTPPVHVETGLLQGDPVLFADLPMIVMAVAHLVNNSREASPEGADVSVSSFRRDSWIVLAVKDRGRGIAPGDLPFVCDHFYTTKTYGAGMGLAIVKRIVSLHNGELEILSPPEGGTEVRMCLPPAYSTE